jgi:signal peptidase I
MRLASAEVAPSFVLELLTRDGAAWVRESSDSMAPLIRPGDRLRLVPIHGNGPRRGDVVAYRRDTELIVHRVLAHDARGVLTKGDALPHRDPVTATDALVGRVVTVVTPSGRRLELDTPRWRVVGGLLAGCSWAGERAASATGEPATGVRRPAWMLTRLAAHVVAWVAR